MNLKNVFPQHVVFLFGAIVIIGLFGLISPTQASINDGLAGYWTFDEGQGAAVSDSSLNGNHGTLTGSPAWVSGKVGSGLQFNGTNYLSIPNSSSLSPGSGMTISMWVNTTATGSKTILSKRHSSSPYYGYSISLDTQTSNRASCTVLNSAGVSATAGAGTNTFTKGAWQHIVCVYDGSSVKVYSNGTQNGYSSNLTGNVFTSNGILYIPLSNAAFSGSIDDVRIYNRALTSQEIADLYVYSGAPGGGGDTIPPVVSGGSPSGILPAGTTSVTLQASTDENATCRYSSIANTAYASMPNTFSTTGGTTHTQALTNLLNGSQYNYFIRCQDSLGNTNATDYSVTFSVAVPADTMPPVISAVASSASANTATITWSTDEASDAYVQYGTTIAYGSQTSSNPSLTMSHTETISGLISGTQYHFRVISKDAGGNTATSSDYVFTTASIPVLSGPLLSWHLDEASGIMAEDASGNNIQGTMANGPARIGGKIGQGSISLDGTNDYISSPDAALLRDLPNGPFSVSMWVRVKNSGSNAFLVAKNANNESTGWYIRLDEYRRAYLYIKRATTSLYKLSGVNQVPAYANGWFHISVSYNGGDSASGATIYINGIPIANYNVNQNGVGAYQSDAGRELRIGRSAYGAYANMDVDEIRIFNRALSAAEVANLYSESDAVPPVAGAGGSIGTSNVTDTSLTLTWTVAQDNFSPASLLQYQVYQSTSANIDTIANIKAYGTAIKPYTANINTFNVANLLPNTPYYFNVLVKDEAGNETAYVMKNGPTLQECSRDTFIDFSHGTDGNILTPLDLGLSTWGWMSGSPWTVQDSALGTSLMKFSSLAYHPLGGSLGSICPNPWPGTPGSVGAQITIDNNIRFAQLNLPSNAADVVTFGFWFKSDYPSTQTGVNIDTFNLFGQSDFLNIPFGVANGSPYIAIENASAPGCTHSSMQVPINPDTFYWITGQYSGVTDGSKGMRLQVYDEAMNRVGDLPGDESRYPCSPQKATTLKFGHHSVLAPGNLPGHNLYWSSMLVCSQGMCPFPLLPNSSAQ